MVSNASEDLPEPLRPVITVRLLRGISTSMFLRLCWRAPWTEICFSIGKPERGKTDIYCRVIRGGGAMDRCRGDDGSEERNRQARSLQFLYPVLVGAPEIGSTPRAKEHP